MQVAQWGLVLFVIKEGVDMAKVVGMHVSSLLADEGTKTYTFAPGINIIYGRNGKGKTSLLSLIASAFDMDTGPLKNIEFEKCAVRISAPEYKTVIVRELERKISYSSSINTKEFYDSMHDVDYLDYEYNDVLDENSFKWKSLRGEDRNFPLDVTFLRVDRIHRLLPDEDSEEGSKFSQQVKQLWATYNSRLVSEIKAKQENAIYDLLLEVDEEIGTDNSSYSEMYHRVVEFSKKREREGRKSFNLSLMEFINRYNNRQDFKRIVNNIVSNEVFSEKVEEPINAIRTVLRQFFSDDINIRLFRNNIHFYNRKGKRIFLDRLSSGEKHILFILVSVASAGSGLVIIDEPELSMHVSWQKSILDAIERINPEAQVVMATHSPEIVASRKDVNFIKI